MENARHAVHSVEVGASASTEKTGIIAFFVVALASVSMTEPKVFVHNAAVVASVSMAIRNPSVVLVRVAPSVNMERGRLCAPPVAVQGFVSTANIKPVAWHVEATASVFITSRRTNVRNATTSSVSLLTAIYTVTNSRGLAPCKTT